LEIENKIISSNDMIIYQVCYLKDGKKLNDSFIIKKRPDKEYIYLCDVIDELIRNDCDYRYMQNNNYDTASFLSYHLLW
jgi:hypothetical protein